MRRFRAVVVGLCALGVVSALVVPAMSGRARVVTSDEGPEGPYPEGMYLQMREAQIAKYRGLPWHTQYNARMRALNKLHAQQRGMATAPSGADSVATAPTWTELGPAPIPNGQPNSGPDSGRVTAIVIDPTDANVVYVGAAQGGVWRTTDGGAHWTALMDSAQSLAIGALALDPNNHTTLWVGTGEPSFSLDSFFGVGLYRITSANTTPTLQGPFDTRVAGLDTTAGNGHAFLGESISKIVIDPANSNRMWVGTSYGYSGMSGDYGATMADPGLYFSSDATNATPTFSLSNNVGDKQVTDIAMKPGDSNTLLVGVITTGYSGDGIYQTTTASSTPGTNADFSLTRKLNLSGVVDGLAVVHFAFGSGGASSTVYAVYDSAGGTVVKSSDSGGTWGSPIASATGFCDGQCWYDMPVAVDPSTANVALIGGNYDYGDPAAPNAAAIHRATDGSTFTKSQTGLHPDTHAIAFSADGNTVWTGNDGGVWKSTNDGSSWTNENTSGLGITQFQSISTHPTDANLTIGGTQDNGTEKYTTGATWTQSDGGDGGFALIDQSSSSTTADVMYHTYFNASGSGGLIGFVRSTNGGATWDQGHGCGFLSSNGISCSDGTLFYAPMALGPGIGTSGTDSLYFGTTKLYRSTSMGNSMSPVSQTFGTPISSIGISPTDDNVRIVGLANGQVFATTTGANPLTSVTGPWDPNFYLARTVVDPTDPSIAYVTLDGYFGNSDSHVWRTSNLGPSATWTAAGSGIPDVPVNAFVIDPNDSTHLFAGTDVGVYESTDSGTSWTPYGSGLPNAAVFDLAIGSPCTSNEVLRAPTHGRGVWEVPISTSGCGGGVDTTPPTASMINPSKTLQFGKSIGLSWAGTDNVGGSGIKDYTVEVSKAPAKGTFSAYAPITALTDVNTTSATFKGATGYTYCFKVRAEDNAIPPNVSSLSTAKCTEVPVDDRALKVVKGPWTRNKDAHSYVGTLTETHSKGATLTIAKVHAKQIGIMWKSCGSCGSFQLIVGTTKYVPKSTKGSGYHFAMAISFSKVKTVTVKIVASTSGRIQIDGLIALVVGPLTFSPSGAQRSAALGWR